MAKPWARLEIGYLDHPKFQALNANAICLWHEGKQYCDRFNTDGLIPTDVAKRFRFGGKKSIEMLTTAINFTKPDGTAYAALWEFHPVGYKMHDYLDHNDCRDAVLSRMDDAQDIKELRRLGNAKRQAEYRAKRKAELDALKHAVGSALQTPRNVAHNVTPTCSTPTETTTPTETETSKERGGAPPAPPVHHRMAPLHDRSHIKHAHCGRVCLHASQFGEFVRRRGGPDPDKEIRDWCMAVEREWGVGGPRESQEPGDPFDFWRARYAEKWPAAPAAKPSTLPEWARGA